MKTTFKAATKTEKISDQIIEQIRDIILSGQVKPGERLASENELITQFDVSKATMREALRVLEVMGLIEIRKGVGGGVFIAEVEMKTTVNSIVNFLHFKSVSIKDITMLRYLLEPTVAQIAASKITDEDIQKLEDIIGQQTIDAQAEILRGISFHRYLARMTQHPVLILILDFIDNLLRDIKSKLKLDAEFYDKVRQSHQRILKCLRQKDGVGAKREMVADLLETENYLSGLTGGDSFDPAEVEGKEVVSDVLAGLNLEALNDQEAISTLQKKGTLFKRVGSGELYLVVLKDKDKGKQNDNQ
ncbi:MAG: FadR family transcriptional regulator [Deltaproteobacteria bacterium]|nr:FadR family transcriptional regulator [Deltaproteobacteria bacterium]